MDLRSAPLNSLGPSTGPSDNSHVPRCRGYNEEQGSDFGSVEDTTTMVFAAIQVDAPDMKYFGVQTDEVDVAPYGTLAALQSRMLGPDEKLIIESDTKIASTQCEEISIAFKSIQCLLCSGNEPRCTSESNSVMSDAPSTHNHILSDYKISHRNTKRVWRYLCKLTSYSNISIKKHPWWRTPTLFHAYALPTVSLLVCNRM